MRLLPLCLLAAALYGQSPVAAEKDAVAAVQKLFDAMKAKDAAAIRAVVLPEARLYSVRGEANPSSSAGEAFATQIAAAKGELAERFTAAPQVSIRGRMAQVWGEYDFHRDGKFTHCGVDTVTLFKTAEGWKIAMIAYTVETTGCKGQ
jgi:ketosteroid isomerase-like protein